MKYFHAYEPPPPGWADEHGYLMLFGHRKSAYTSIVVILLFLTVMALFHVSGMLVTVGNPACTWFDVKPDVNRLIMSSAIVVADCAAE